MELFTRENYTLNLSWDKVGNEEDIIIDMEYRIREDTAVSFQDIISDVADDNIEIYTKALWDLAPIISYWIEEGLSEFGIGRSDGLEQLFMRGQYLYNVELLNGNIYYIIYNLACDILEDLLEKELTKGELSETDIEILGYNIADYLQLMDIHYKSDVIESMENLLEDYKNGGL